MPAKLLLIEFSSCLIDASWIASCVLPTFVCNNKTKIAIINAGCKFQDQGGITIGEGTLIGHNVVLATLNHVENPDDRVSMTHRPIVIGKKIWIGSNATVLQGVTIGDGAIVAAGTVVTKNVESKTVIGGVPARFIKKIED